MGKEGITRINIIINHSGSAKACDIFVFNMGYHTCIFSIFKINFFYFQAIVENKILLFYRAVRCGNLLKKQEDGKGCRFSFSSVGKVCYSRDVYYLTIKKGNNYDNACCD